MDDQGIEIRFAAGAGDLFLRQRVLNGCGIHPASYSVVTGGSFPRSKAAWTCWLTTDLLLAARLRKMELYLHPRMFFHGLNRDSFVYIIIISFKLLTLSLVILHEVSVRQSVCVA
jgi:hypothetical protein